MPGLPYSTGDLTFNPGFSGWMMGRPPGWTDPAVADLIGVVTGAWLLHRGIEALRAAVRSAAQQRSKISLIGGSPLSYRPLGNDNRELSSLCSRELIKEIQLSDEIEQIEEDYEAEFGQPPVNVSTWDPSVDVVDADLLATMPPVQGAGKDYIFSYILQDNAGLRSALGYTDSRWKSLVAHSGSASIVMACNWLRASGAKKVLVLGPRYFTVPHCLQAFGIGFDTQHFVRTNEGYKGPEACNILEYDGVWVTNPIYGTGVYIDRCELVQLHKNWSQKGKFFILDECLASPRLYAGPSLEPNERTTILAAPHKSVCVNAYKFAVSLMEVSQLEHFEHWSDVWLGCLPQSSSQAIEHVRGRGFFDYQSLFDAAIEEPVSIFAQLTSQIPKAETDASAKGYFRSIYFPELPAELGLDPTFLRDATFSTGASFIPGIRNDLNPDTGLSFRVNLAAFGHEARGAFVRLSRWMSSRC